MRTVPRRMEPRLSRLPFRSRHLRYRPQHHLAKSPCQRCRSHTSHRRDDTSVLAATDAALTPIAVLAERRQEQPLPLSVPPLLQSSSIPLLVSIVSLPTGDQRRREASVSGTARVSLLRIGQVPLPHEIPLDPRIARASSAWLRARVLKPK